MIYTSTSIWLGGWLSGAPARAFLLDAHLRVYTGALFGYPLGYPHIRGHGPLYPFTGIFTPIHEAPRNLSKTYGFALFLDALPLNCPLPFRGVENRAVAFQDRGPPGPYPSVVVLGGVGERAPPLTLKSLSFPPSPWGRSAGKERQPTDRAEPYPYPGPFHGPLP